MNQILLLLDNWPVHKAKKVLKYIEKLKCKAIFLPAYSLEYAPIELFFNTFKIRLSKQWRNQYINLSKDNGAKNIREVFSTFTRDEIVSNWTNAIREINDEIQVFLGRAI